MVRFMFVALSCVFAIASAGFLDSAVKGTTTDYADFFTNSFQSVKDLIPNDQSGLGTNINRVKDLLTAINTGKRLLEPMADDSQRGAMRSVGGFLQEVTQFGNKVGRDGENKFNQNKNMWTSLLGKVFTSGGVMQLLPLLTKASSTMSVAGAVIVPLVVMILRI